MNLLQVFARPRNITTGAARNIVVCCIFSGLWLTPSAAAESVLPLTVWTVPGLDRVGQHDSSSGIATVQLYAARGEYESFQIVVHSSDRQLTGVTITCSDLAGPAGKIDRSNFTLYREQYVYVKKSSPDWQGSNRPLGPGWYPDALMPLNAPDIHFHSPPFNVERDINQPVWIDIFVPRNTPRGTYKGTATIESRQGKAKVPINLQVWGFELPKKPHLLSSFGYWRPLQHSVTEELLRNKVMPLIVTSCRGDGPDKCVHNSVIERDLIDNFGLAATDAFFWSGASIDHCAMSAPPSVAQFQKAASAHERDLLLYNYTADEIHTCSNLIPEMKIWAQNMHKAGILNLVTIAPNPALYDDGNGKPAVDIWVMTPAVYDSSKAEIAKVLSMGMRIWSYNGLVQDAYSPKWEIDFLPVNFRIQPGFISQSLGITGLLYWRIDNWSPHPWTDPIDNTGQFHPTASYAGDGMLVYPGDAVGVRGVVASMRLKQIRDGIEDYEYVELMKEYGRGTKGLELARSVGADWTHWTRDSAALYAARKKLGDALDELWRTQQGK